MTTEELRLKVADSVHKDFYNGLEARIFIDFLEYNQTLKGITSISQLCETQIELWSKYENNLPDIFINSRRNFQIIKEEVERLFAELERGNYSTDSFRNNWNNTISSKLTGRTNSPFFLADLSETEFLLGVYKNYNINFNGALQFILNTQNFNYNDKNFVVGYLMAYEFKFKDISHIVERKKKESRIITETQKNFNDYLSKTETQIVDYLQKANEKQTNFSKFIDELKLEKETLINSWFNEAKNTFENQNKEAVKKIEDLEKTYDEKLRLEKPAIYWKERGTYLKKQGYIALTIVLFFVIGICLTLGEILWHSPEQIFASFFGNDKSAAIRWSIVYITLISFLAFGLKALIKYMFSSFHLSRDSEERYTLTYFYLSLINEKKVSDADRTLILQSLFSRADTGLLKDDAAPTMPTTEIVSSVMRK